MKAMQRIGWSCLVVMGASLVAEISHAQLQPSRKARTTASKSDYRTGYNMKNRRPRNYDQYYRAARSGYQLSPYLVVPKAAPRPVVPVAPYSDLEYGAMITAGLEASPVAASSSTHEQGTSILKLPRTEAGFIQTQVMGVLDRGVLLLRSGEQVRLRGVRMLSSNSRDETTRLYGREGTERLQALTAGKEIFVLTDEPLRDHDGFMLVTAFLPDGTEVNRMLLEEGLGQLHSQDFAAEVNFDPLKEAESAARNAKIGLWSRF